MNTNPSKDIIRFKKWDKEEPPARVLVIRFHSIGDVIASLPACAGLKLAYPGIQIDFLTADATAGLMDSAGIFSNTYSVPFARSENKAAEILNKIKTKSLLTKTALQLKKNKYDIIIDLQHNKNSGIIIKILNVPYYSEFDRYAPLPHTERVLNAFQNAGFETLKESFDIPVNEKLLNRAKEILLQNGWLRNRKLVVLNPAGFWVTRNWPPENYKSLSRMLVEKDNAQLIFLGDERIRQKTYELKKFSGGDAVDLTGKTSIEEAFAVLSYCSTIVSEDSALLHMAWTQGIKGVQLLGSTRSDWSTHKTGNIITLSSNDLECGNCMQETCRYGDVHCLTRYTSEFVYEKIRRLLN
jgi:heptosyltransferase II